MEIRKIFYNIWTKERKPEWVDNLIEESVIAVLLLIAINFLAYVVLGIYYLFCI